MTRYVILGTGAAGIEAAVTIRQHDQNGEIICVSAETAGYYSRPGLAYYLSKELGEKSLYPFSDQDFKSKNITLYHNTATRIDHTKKEVEFHDNKTLQYDRLLLALGAKAVHPDVEGINLDGVVYLDSMTQTKSMIKKSRRGKSAVVVGGGITALEIVEGLKARKMKVNFFLRKEHYWNHVLDNIESQLVLNSLEHDGVIIHRNTELKKINGNRGKVNGVITKDDRQIQAGMIAFAIGVRPRTELAAASGLNFNRGIQVNQFMETNQRDIYAAGDAVEVYDPLSGNWVVDSLWHIAREQGKTAGLNMVRQRSPYQRRSPVNVTRLAGITTTIIGRVGSRAPGDEYQIVRGESETWQEMPEAVVCQNNFKINRLRVMVGDTKLVGAVLMGDQSLSQPLEDLVANEVDISSIRQALLVPGANLGSILHSYWTDWRTDHAN